MNPPVLSLPHRSSLPPPPPRFSQLSAPQQRLVRLMQRVNFGRLENLVIRGGQPDFDPPPRVVCEIKFAGENGPRPEEQATDFTLKEQLIDLLAHLDQLKNASVEVLTVKHGLPFSMNVEANA